MNMDQNNYENYSEQCSRYNIKVRVNLDEVNVGGNEGWIYGKLSTNIWNKNEEITVLILA